jgi:hypothetical protein
MDALDLDISALCEDAKAPSRRYWLPVMVTGLGREYAKRWFTDKRKEGNDFPFALVVAETEDEARKWAHGCTDVEAVTPEQIEYRVQACFPRCVGALLVRREHGDARFYWLTQTTSDLT